MSDQENDNSDAQPTALVCRGDQVMATVKGEVEAEAFVRSADPGTYEIKVAVDDPEIGQTWLSWGTMTKHPDGRFEARPTGGLQD